MTCDWLQYSLAVITVAERSLWNGSLDTGVMEDCRQGAALHACQLMKGKKSYAHNDTYDLNYKKISNVDL